MNHSKNLKDLIQNILSAYLYKNILIFIFLVINTSLLIWYILYGYQLFFHSDSAVKVLLAREILETGNYFPSDWNYANGDLFVFFGHAFIIPLLAFFPAGYTVHAISGIISTIIILSGVWLLSSIATKSSTQKLLIIAIVAAGFSGVTAESLYGQVSYGSVIYFSCYIIFFTWKFITSSNVHNRYYGLALGLALGLAFWANPQRALLTYIIPLSIALLSHQLYCSTKKTQVKNKITSAFFIIIFSSLLGIVFHTITISNVNNVAGAAHLRWLSYEDMLKNFSLILKQYLAVFNGIPNMGNVVVSKSGIYEAIKLSSALALLIMSFLSIKNSVLNKSSSTAFISIFGLISLLSVLFLQITTTLPDMSDPVQSSRYLIPSLFILAIVTLLTTYSYKTQPILAISNTMIIIVFLTSAYMVYVKSDTNSNNQWGQKGQRHHNSTGIVDFLTKNNLHYGYGTYWNAGILSVLSDEEVLVRQISINQGLPSPMRHLSSNRWYRPDTWTGKTFLLLSKGEAEKLDLIQMAVYNTRPIQLLKFENFHIYVFEQNIAKNLPNWDTRYINPSSFPATKYSLSHVGNLISNKNNEGSTLIAEKGDVGALHYGPYISVEPGNYKITFDVLAPYHPDGSLKLDVASTQGQALYAEKLFNSSTSPQELLITVGQQQTLEFRVWALGNEQVTFKSVKIIRVHDN